MKTVLFCGGLGTRIRDYSESVPKPMIPVGDKPILWHLMQYYSQYGHRDFVLCLGYKANVIKDFFLNYRPHIYADCVVSGFGDNIETLGDPQRDWRITMIDTGLWRNIGERLLAVRSQVESEEVFLANYSDGLADVDLPAMVETFRQSGKIACFLAVRPLSACISSTWSPAARSPACAPPRMPTSGSTVASSPSALRSSTICARARNWSRHPSGD